MKTILCFGDSNTWGAATVPRPDSRYAPDERWPGVLAAGLGSGVGVLLGIIQNSQTGPNGGAPKALVICPPPILQSFGERPDFVEMFAGGYEKSLRLAAACEAVAREYGAAFLDAGTVIRSSAFDGIHLDVDAHAALGRAVAETVRKLGW